MWNCTATLVNYGFRIRNGWEKPLFCNSLAIFAAFRTASADAQSDFVERSGYGPVVHVIGDQIIHTLPCIVIGISMMRHKRFARPQHGAFALLGQIFFAYSQAGKMDLGEIYVPHDVTFAWIASLFGQLLAPIVINNAIKRRWKRVFFTLLVVMSPYLLKKIGLRKLINKRTIAYDSLRGKEDIGKKCFNQIRKIIKRECLTCLCSFFFLFIIETGLFNSKTQRNSTVCNHCGTILTKRGRLTVSKSLIDLPSLV
jgi:hypothetical protein